MTYSPETEANIKKHTAIRDERIAELKILYARLCRLQGKKVSSDVFNELIDTKFQTTSGVKSLTYESIEIVKTGLLESIAKTENKAKQKQFAVQEQI